MAGALSGVAWSAKARGVDPEIAPGTPAFQEVLQGSDPPKSQMAQQRQLGSRGTGSLGSHCPAPISAAIDRRRLSQFRSLRILSSCDRGELRSHSDGPVVWKSTAEEYLPRA